MINRVIKDHYFDINTLGIETYDGIKVPLQTFKGKYMPSSSGFHIPIYISKIYYIVIKCIYLYLDIFYN